jgi:hypothetical protein
VTMTSARSLAALGALFSLVACGGGGGNGASPPPPAPSPSSMAVLSVSLSGGASPGIDHLWVTVTGVALHADATRVYGDGDPGWVVQTLATPVTVDLADPALADGGTLSLFKTSVAALGTFKQLRLLVASPDPAGTPLASAVAKGLQYNDQVQYTDAGGAHIVPLEVPDLQAGLRLLTPFNLSGDTTTPLGIEWNANALVRRASATAGAPDRFTLRNELQLYNQQLLTGLGDADLHIDGSIFDSISGQLDTTGFCTGSSHAGCIHDVVASATSLSPDSRFHAEVRSVDVGADGTFLLYPLPSQTFFDVVIRGGNIQTIVVHDVFVDPTGLLRAAPTALSSATTPLAPVLDTTERAVSVANALVPAGSRVFFGQTVTGSGSDGSGVDVPYTIESGATDPATGRLLDTLTLPGGPLHYAVFDTTRDGNGVPPPFTTVTPAEGAGAWTVWTQGTLATTTSASAALAAGAVTLSVPAPVARTDLGAGTITVKLSGTPSTAADHAELIVSDDGGIVAVADVSAQLAAHGGSTAVNVASGASADAPAAARYGVALRTWVGGAETTTARWSRTSAPVDLSTATTADVSLVLP